MRKGVHARLRIILNLGAHPIHDPGGSRRRRNFAGIEDIQRKRIIRLIPRPIGNGRARLESQRFRCGSGQVPLIGKGSGEFRQQPGIDPVVIQEESSRLAFLEIPQHPLG